MKILIAVALGGGLGATLRYLLVQLAQGLFGTGFPYGILTANVLGSFVMGAFAAWLAATGALSGEIRAFVAVGVLGGFTTFSSFSLDTVVLAERGDFGLAAAYVAVSLVLSIGALLAGLALVRSLAAS
ncbi:MAG: fluoride efflux transporter CrcB [Alphaproteobacteria bacterium]|nr:fluoride efflux transporter CrcB [Alphaproteobacteria bacterium]